MDAPGRLLAVLMVTAFALPIAPAAALAATTGFSLWELAVYAH